MNRTFLLDEENKKEIWLPVVGYVGLYEVSNFGRVRSLNYNHTGKTRVLSPLPLSCGYLQVCLCKNGEQKKFYIHRLVAQAFIPNWFDEKEVNHLDENKHNNFCGTPENDFNDGNLEWCDRKYNINYGTRNERVSEKIINGKRSKTVLQLTKTGELVREWPSIGEVDRNGYNKGAVAACCRGERKSHKGFIWRYKEVS